MQQNIKKLRKSSLLLQVTDLCSLIVVIAMPHNVHRFGYCFWFPAIEIIVC